MTVHLYEKYLFELLTSEQITFTLTPFSLSHFERVTTSLLPNFIPSEAQFLHHFYSSENVTPSLFIHFTRFVAQFFRHFAPSEQKAALLLQNFIPLEAKFLLALAPNTQMLTVLNPEDMNHPLVLPSLSTICACPTHDGSSLCKLFV